MGSQPSCIVSLTEAAWAEEGLVGGKADPLGSPFQADHYWPENSGCDPASPPRGCDGAGSEALGRSFRAYMGPFDCLVKLLAGSPRRRTGKRSLLASCCADSQAAIAEFFLDAGLFGMLPDESFANILPASHLLGRIGEPVEGASVIGWLLDGARAWITGQVIGMDGGQGSLQARA